MITCLLIGVLQGDTITPYIFVIDLYFAIRAVIGGPNSKKKKQTDWVGGFHRF